VTELLDDGEGPIIAVTDFMKAVPDQIGRWIPAGRRFVPLGTDGFGRSDTRERLREFFEVDMPQVVVATLWGLAQQGEVKAETVAEAISHYGIDVDRPDPRAADL
jgi:pyruvate dehydrogenase E1 component